MEAKHLQNFLNTPRTTVLIIYIIVHKLNKIVRYRVYYKHIYWWVYNWFRNVKMFNRKNKTSILWLKPKPWIKRMCTPQSILTKVYISHSTLTHGRLIFQSFHSYDLPLSNVGLTIIIIIHLAIKEKLTTLWLFLNEVIGLFNRFYLKLLYEYFSFINLQA